MPCIAPVLKKDSRPSRSSLCPGKAFMSLKEIDILEKDSMSSEVQFVSCLQKGSITPRKNEP